jgi:hypothetical protein
LILASGIPFMGPLDFPAGVYVVYTQTRSRVLFPDNTRCTNPPEPLCVNGSKSSLRRLGVLYRFPIVRHRILRHKLSTRLFDNMPRHGDRPAIGCQRQRLAPWFSMWGGCGLGLAWRLRHGPAPMLWWSGSSLAQHPHAEGCRLKAEGYAGVGSGSESEFGSTGEFGGGVAGAVRACPTILRRGGTELLAHAGV